MDCRTSVEYILSRIDGCTFDYLAKVLEDFESTEARNELYALLRQLEEDGTIVAEFDGELLRYWPSSVPIRS